MPLTKQQITRSQARLAAVENRLDHLGALYEMVATGAVTESEVLAVFTAVIDDEKRYILTLLADLYDPGADQPIDQPAATQGRLRVERGKGVLGYLLRTLPGLTAPLHADEDGNTVADLTTEQRDAVDASIARAVEKLRSAVASA
jgi:hypothetical protein